MFYFNFTHNIICVMKIIDLHFQKKFKKFILDAIKNPPFANGTEAEIYDAKKYVIRVPLAIKKDLNKKIQSNDYKIIKAPNIWNGRNFGQKLFALITNGKSKHFVTVNKKVNGFTTNDLMEEPLTKEQKISAQKTAIKKMRIFALAPQKSYERLIDDLNYINTTGFAIDPSEGNMLFNPKTKRFHIIDLRYTKKIRNLGDLILLLLTDIPNTPENKEYYELEETIINKLIIAAHSVGFIFKEQLDLKPRALEVIKSKKALKIYKENFDKMPLLTKYKDASVIYKKHCNSVIIRKINIIPT